MDLKPTIEFSRKPRSIFEVANFKATELMNLLFYYLRYCIVGILPNKVVKNFEKLSAATYILCKKEIKRSEMETARGLLREFAKEFEEIYGNGAVTMNVHLVLHQFDNVLQSGPTWCNNMFGFENKIGDLKKLVCGPTDVLSQIATKYVISLNAKINEDDNNMKKAENDVYQKSTINLQLEYKDVFENAGFSSNSMQIWKRIRKNGVLYSSTSAVATKSIDYFVKMKNGSFGNIEFFFGSADKPQLLLNVFDELKVNFHWVEIKQSSRYQIHFSEEIDEKWLFFDTGSIQFTTKEPNTYNRGE